MPETSVRSIVVAAPVARVADVICDFNRYPEWASGIRKVDVLETYPDGRPASVRFVVDTAGLRDEYTLMYEYEHPAGAAHIGWRLAAPSKMQRAQQGSYDISDRGDGSCTVTYTLTVELSIGMLGMLKRKAEKMIMDTALTGLKRRAESPDGAR